MLVVPLDAALEPLGEGCVELRSFRLRQARVGDLARERMLDRVLSLARDRGTDTTANEVAVFEQAEVGTPATDQLVDRTRPEDAPDYRRRLQCGLLVGRQQVDAGGEHGLHRVGNLEVRWQLAHRPAAVLAA